MNLPVSASACGHCGTAGRPGARFCRACGKPLGEPEPLPVPAPSPLPEAATIDTPLQRRRLRARLIAGVVVVLALTAGWAVTTAADRVLYPPDRPVRALFAALAAKDTTALRALVSCRSGPLCGPGALGSGYEPPTGLRITDVRRGNVGRDDLTRPAQQSSAAVLVRYTVGGKTVDDVVAVHRGGWFDDWSISAAPGWPLTVDSPHVPQVRVAAATVTTHQDIQLDGTRPYRGEAWALPGVYTIAVADDPLYTADPVRLTVAGRSQQTKISPAVRLRDNLAADVDRQVKARIDACATQHTAQPDIDHALLSGVDCPFSANERYTIVRNITWRITMYPQVTLAVGDSRPVPVKTVTKGEAVISYDWTTDILEPRRWTPFSEPIAFSVGGHAITGDDGTMVWTP